MNFSDVIIFGAKYLYLVIVGAALWYLWQLPKEMRFRVVVCAALALPLTYVMAKLASELYYDPRPFVVGNFVPLIPHAPNNGFPSDHTLLSAAVASVILFFNRKWGMVLLVIAFLVGLARVAAGIHHVTDIVGSVVIALIVTRLVFQVFLASVTRYVAPFFQKNDPTSTH